MSDKMWYVNWRRVERLSYRLSLKRLICALLVFSFGSIFGCTVSNSVWISCVTHQPVKPVKPVNVDCGCSSNSVNVCVCDGVSSNFCWKCFHLSCDCPKFKGVK